MAKRIVLTPIGVVRNRIRTRGRRDWSRVVSRLVLASEHKERLNGIEGYSHVVVLFWMDRVSPRERRRVNIVPYGIVGAGPKGVLATRMPPRPNPIGVTTARLRKRQGNILIVSNLDALNGTPILDVKPYTGHSREQMKQFSVPKWDRELRKKLLRKKRELR